MGVGLGGGGATKSEGCDWQIGHGLNGVHKCSS